MQQKIIETYFPSTAWYEQPKPDDQVTLGEKTEIIEQFLMKSRQYLGLD